MTELIETMIDNCKHGQTLYFKAPEVFNGDITENSLSYFIKYSGEDNFTLTTVFRTALFDCGADMSYDSNPVHKMINLKALQETLQENLIDYVKVFKGGLPYLFKTNNKNIKGIDTNDTVYQESQFRCCKFFSYLAEYSYLWWYNVRGENLREYTPSQEDDFEYQICANISYTSPKPPIDLFPKIPPVFFLNNRYLLFRELDCITLLAHDDNRVEFITQANENNEDHLDWIVVEKSTGLSLHLGVIDKKSGNYIKFPNEDVFINNPIFTEFLKLRKINQ